MQQWEPREKKRKRIRRWYIRKAVCFALVVFAVLLAAGLVRFFIYKAEQRAAEDASAELRRAYHEESPAAPTPAPASANESNAFSAAAADGLEGAHETAAQDSWTAADRLELLQEENADIVGWLTIEGLLDEPVVQRDNTFYLDHDAKGRENINGALFLDEIVRLDGRQNAVIIYGHNMRSGAMFGSLYKYEDAEYLQKHALIEFDSVYGAEKYAVFAAGIINIDQRQEEHIDICSLNSSAYDQRKNALEKLAKISANAAEAEVDPSDRFLVLVTCVNSDAERLIVAARRVGEERR